MAPRETFLKEERKMKRSAIVLTFAACGCLYLPEPKLAVLAPGLAPVPADSVRVVSAVADSCAAVVQIEERADEREAAIRKMIAEAGAYGANRLILGNVRNETTTSAKIMWGNAARSAELMDAVGYFCAS